MTGLGIQAWGLLLNGLRIGFWHGNVMDVLEILRVFGHSYRLASMGGSSVVVFSRFTLGFCWTVVVTTVFKRAWRMPALQALTLSGTGSSQFGGFAAGTSSRGVAMKLRQLDAFNRRRRSSRFRSTPTLRLEAFWLPSKQTINSRAGFVPVETAFHRSFRPKLPKWLPLTNARRKG